MAATIDEITVDYEENGILLVKEVDKEVLTRGGWTTIIFKFQQFDPKKEDYGPEKYTIRRYRKMGDSFRQQSKFNISNAKQARQLAEILDKWAAEAGA
jgi:hypothetical protein